MVHFVAQILNTIDWPRRFPSDVPILGSQKQSKIYLQVSAENVLVPDHLAAVSAHTAGRRHRHVLFRQVAVQTANQREATL